jgi:hypothetical protein
MKETSFHLKGERSRATPAAAGGCLAGGCLAGGWSRISHGALLLACVLSAACGLAAAPASALPPLAWSTPLLIDPAPTVHANLNSRALDAVSCPSVSLCIAVDALGNVLTSAGGTWTVTPVGTQYLVAVSCPAVSLCVAVGDSGVIVTSTNPTGGAGAWTTTTLAGVGDFSPVDLAGVSCPTTSSCVAVGRNGMVLASTNPTGGAGAWSVVFAAPGDDLAGVSCPSLSLCAAVGDTGLLTSISPTTHGAWKTTRLGTSRDRPRLVGVSCPSVSLCVTIDAIGSIFSSTDPTGGATAWRAAAVIRTVTEYSPLLKAVSCASVSLCVVTVNDASDQLINPGGCGSGRACAPLFNDGGVFASRNPTGGPAAWSRTHVDGPNQLSAVSCPSASLCAAVDQAGNVVVGAPTALDLGAPRATVTAGALRISRHAGKLRLGAGVAVACPPAGPACTVTGAAVKYPGVLPILGRTRTSIPAGGRRVIFFDLTRKSARDLQRRVRSGVVVDIYTDLLARTGSGPSVAIKRLGVFTD